MMGGEGEKAVAEAEQDDVQRWTTKRKADLVLSTQTP
jgi:hypothetical protein